MRIILRYITLSGNVTFPLLLGFLIYLERGLFYSWIPNYIPDGMWSFSFTSLILWIWNGTLCYFNIILLMITFSSLELLQFNGILKGTGDFLDIIIYFFFAIIAILYFKCFIRVSPNIKYL